MHKRKPPTSSRETGAFDADGFYAALDAVRAARSLAWRQVASESGVSASTLTRMGQGRRPDVDSLAALAAWANLDADRFVRRRRGQEPEQNTLDAISTYLRCDKHLTPEGAEALEEIIRAAYQGLPKRS